MRNDCAYFARRAAEEHSAAERSVHPKVRAAHAEMARLYADLASGKTQRPAHLIGIPANAERAAIAPAA